MKEQRDHMLQIFVSLPVVRIEQIDKWLRQLILADKRIKKSGPKLAH